MPKNMDDHKHEHDHPHNHGHDHDHDHDHDHSHSHGVSHFAGAAPKVLVRAIIITALFMVIELVGGWYANSLALLTDGAHMLTDIAAMVFSLFAIWVSRKPVTAMMSYGYHRAEILGALASGLAIWLLSGGLVYEAVLRLQSPPEVQGPIVFVVAAIGLVANLLSMKMLHGSMHDNMNVRAAYLHMLTDAMGSVGAVIAGIVLWLTGWRPIDPIITILAAILMLYSSWELVKEAVGILMESTPTGVNPDKIKTDLQAIPGVGEVHDLHIWTVSTGRLAMSVHLVAEDATQTLKLAHEVLSQHFGIIHTTIQIEHPKDFASDRCYDCAP